LTFADRCKRSLQVDRSISWLSSMILLDVVKSKYVASLKQFEIIMTNASGCKIAKIRSDKGGEYIWVKCRPLTSAEWSWRKIHPKTCWMCTNYYCSCWCGKRFWAEAVAAAAYLRNRVPNSAIKGNLSPYEKWYRRKPKVHQLGVFGCMSYAHAPDGERRKFNSKAKGLRFCGLQLYSRKVIDYMMKKRIK